MTLFTALSAAALCPGLVAADAVSPAGSTNAPTALPDVVVKGTAESGYKPETVSTPKISTPLRDTPQTINVVPRQVIEEQNATTLRDVLRNVPGISFQAGEGGVPAGDQLSIRGQSARTDLFVDGVRDVAGYTRDSFNVEQVEVFKGPNSVYSGRGSTGGAVNMVTKTPKTDPFYNATLSYGSSDYYRATIDLNQPVKELSKYGLEDAAFRLNGLYHEQDFAKRDYIHDQRWAVNPTFGAKIGDKTRLDVYYLHLDEDNLAGYGLPFVSTSTNAFGGLSAVGKVAPYPYHTFLGLVDRDFEKINSNIGGLRVVHDFSDDLKLQNQTRYGLTRRDSVIASPRFVLPQTTNEFVLRPDPVFGPNTAAAGNAAPTPFGVEVGLNHEAQSRLQTDSILANQMDLRAKFDTGKLGHELVTSLEYSHEEEINYLRSGVISPVAPFPAQTSNPLAPSAFDPFHPVRRTGAYNQAMVDSAGLSLFDTIKISDQWLGTVGARADLFSAEYKLVGTSGAIAGKFKRTDIEPTWRAGVVYKPLSYGSVFFGYGTSFNPSAEGFTLAGNTASLEPETGQSFELGTKWDLLNERLSVSGALFRTAKSNYRNTDPVTGIVSTTGDVRVDGIEVGISGKITEKWNVYAGYAIMESEIEKSATITAYNGVRISEQGHDLSNTPEQTASISTTYELPWRLTVGTSFFFVDQRFSNNIETQGVPGYWLQDASLSWAATKNVAVRLNVSNLWNEDYIDRVGGGHAIPGVGRTVIVTTAFKF